MKKLIISSAVLSALIVPVSYMAFDNQPPYEYDVEHSYIVPSVTPAGRQMTVHWKLTKVYRVCVGSITKHVVDQDTTVRFSYDPTPAARTIDIIDGDVLHRTFFLPPDVTTGMKWYFADGEFACNPLQHFYPLRVRTPRLSFEVK